MQESDKPLFIHPPRPKDLPVYITTVTSDDTTEIAPMSMYNIGKYIEISVVIEGSGLHSLLSETSECQAGDMYILSSEVSHKYVDKSKDEKMTGVTLLFDSSSMLSDKYSDPDDSLLVGKTNTHLKEGDWVACVMENWSSGDVVEIKESQYLLLRFVNNCAADTDTISVAFRVTNLLIRTVS